jgi:hypothetical protein
MQDMEPFEVRRSWALLSRLAALFIIAMGTGVCLAFGVEWWPILLLSVPFVGYALVGARRADDDRRVGHIPNDELPDHDHDGIDGGEPR